MHEPQAPLPSHTLFVPQEVPPGLLPASTQLAKPPEQSVVPSLQMPGFVEHELPEVHETQLPPELQTLLVPQLVPAGRGLPLTQVDVPVEHEVTPVQQELLGLVEQLLPAVHETQLCELLHTAFTPHGDPVDLAAPSTQVGPPVVQLVTPE